MKKELNDLDKLKQTNPFKVPDGYMEGLTARIMDQLPEQTEKEAKKVTMMDRMRPWLYMAAVFAGLGLFFRAIVGIDNGDRFFQDSLLVQSDSPIEWFYQPVNIDDDEYLEYIEVQYTDRILSEELDYFE